MSSTTVIVLVANGLTATISCALLMLVLWQAPRRRMNRLFALTMFLLGSYSITNGFGRFIDRLSLPPAHTTYIAIELMGTFTVIMFFFASEFAQQHTPVMRAMRLAGALMVITHSYALWTDRLIVNIRPVPGQEGSFKGDWTTLGLVVVVTQWVYLLIAAALLYRMDDERGRALWRAPVLIMLASLSSALLWPLLHFPAQAVLLALAALALGVPVLRYELFSPLAGLHAELARKNAELSEASRLKSQFLAHMSHELRTPLNSVIGYTELVLSGTYGPLNDTQRDRLEKVVRNGYNLLSLIRDVIDLNRIETGYLTLNRAPVDTVQALNTALDTVAPLAAHKGLELVRDFAGAPPALGDEMHIRQMATNLLANAIKFTDAGQVMLRARGDDQRIVITISDTGMGIAPDQVERIFGEFQQGDSAAVHSYDGAGLGLAITKRLAELHGGHIALESQPGSGTVVTLTLPAAADEGR
ncbi:MAG: HAMP domain-containing sensor histidine kinase [Anaerolineae bacterium]|nr:HAMP domain-containing sensor histidine kinase [Anaerolineae bacterium]